MFLNSEMKEVLYFASFLVIFFFSLLVIGYSIERLKHIQVKNVIAILKKYKGDELTVGKNSVLQLREKGSENNKLVYTFSFIHNGEVIETNSYNDKNDLLKFSNPWFQDIKKVLKKEFKKKTREDIEVGKANESLEKKRLQANRRNYLSTKLK